MTGPAPECFRCGDPYGRHWRGLECRARDRDGRCPCPGYLSPATWMRDLIARRVRRMREPIPRRTLPE